MPDVVLFDPKREWLVLVESVTSHGPVDGKRHAELAKLFGGINGWLGLRHCVPNARHHGPLSGRNRMGKPRYGLADAPSHLIHFNGERFLGPYSLVPDSHLVTDRQNRTLCCEFPKIVPPLRGWSWKRKVAQCLRTGLINAAPPVLVKPRHEKSRFPRCACLSEAGSG